MGANDSSIPSGCSGAKEIVKQNLWRKQLGLQVDALTIR